MQKRHQHYPLRANGLLDDHHPALGEPTQNDLRDGLDAIYAAARS
jgi:hypothetical protein